MTFGAKYILQLHKIIFSPADQPYFANFNPAVEFFLKFSLKECTNIDVADWYHPFSTYAKFFEKKNYFLPMPLPPSPLFLKSYFARDVFQGNSLLYHSQRHPKFFWPRHFQNFVGGPATA